MACLRCFWVKLKPVDPGPSRGASSTSFAQGSHIPRILAFNKETSVSRLQPMRSLPPTLSRTALLTFLRGGVSGLFPNLPQCPLLPPCLELPSSSSPKVSTSVQISRPPTLPGSLNSWSSSGHYAPSHPSPHFPPPVSLKPSSPNTHGLVTSVRTPKAAELLGLGWRVSGPPCLAPPSPLIPFPTHPPPPRRFVFLFVCCILSSHVQKCTCRFMFGSSTKGTHLSV